MKKLLLIGIAATTVGGCIAAKTHTTMPCATPRATRPSERLLVMGGEADSPMQVVENDNQAGQEMLRTTAAAAEPRSPVTTRLVSRMLASVEAEGGVGIAAPQVGISRRVILVKRLDVEPGQPFRVYFNPRITRFSDETLIDWEGCLSIPAGFGKVERAASIDIEYTTPAGEPASETVEGFTARIFQHEIDHLDGILFIDRKEPGPLMPEAEYREMRKREKEKEKKKKQEAEGAPEAGAVTQGTSSSS